MESIYNYFDLIPSELINIILYYIDDYESFINLYKLPPIKAVIDSPSFWKQLFKNTLGYLLDAIQIDFNNKNIYYMASSYVRSLRAYSKYKITNDFFVEEVNKGIKKYYPDMDIDNKDLDRISRDDNYDNLIEEGFKLMFNAKFLNISLVWSFTSTNDILNSKSDPQSEYYDFELGDYYHSLNNEFYEKCELIIDFTGYHIIMADINELFELTKDRFEKILFNAYFQGGHITGFTYGGEFAEW